MSKSFIKRNRQNIPNVEMQVCKKPEIFYFKDHILISIIHKLNLKFNLHGYVQVFSGFSKSDDKCGLFLIARYNCIHR